MKDLVDNKLSLGDKCYYINNMIYCFDDYNSVGTNLDVKLNENMTVKNIEVVYSDGELRLYINGSLMDSVESSDVSVKILFD